ncbi:MAG: type IV secretion system DNA-binding domain-containing protein, partial [Verrucomicrobia bacterium]|nr:type IV secretion system DNA-binding domain-containing protein [Verrucomicrobiota bacterium]
MGRSVPTVPTEIPLVSWRCYEPAGHRVELTEADLVQHVLLVGSTGSGKSTLLVDAIRQLTAHEARSRRSRTGLLILDAKADDLVSRVQEAAALVGRADDVLLFGPCGDRGLDLFGAGLKSLDDVNRVTQQALLGLDRFGGDNAYWWQATTAMLNAAFALLVASGETISFASTVEFLRGWFLSRELPPLLLELVQRIGTQSGRRDPMLATALDQVELWRSLDPKTKSNLQSCLLLVLQPFLSPSAARCFSPKSGKVSSPAQAATEGRIAVISVNCMTEPDLARCFFRLGKQLFFDAIQQRRQPARLCGLVADEFPLVVTREDAEQLATVRSKRCFVIAATQGLNGLSERIGIGQARAVVNHFNTAIPFMGALIALKDAPK